QLVLDALYRLEAAYLSRNQFDPLFSPADIANALPSSHPKFGNASWVRQELEDLWVTRKVLQIPAQVDSATRELRDIELRGRDSFQEDSTTSRLLNESNDVRGNLDH